MMPTKEEAVLQMVKDGTITPEQAETLIRRDGFKLNIEENGAISATIPGRLSPVTLFPNVWERLFEHEKDFKSFIKDNRKKLERMAASFRN